jgi:hypothetical protein
MNGLFQVSSLSFSPDATLIAAAFVGAGFAFPVMVWNADGVLVARLSTDRPNGVVGFSPTGDKLFAGSLFAPCSLMIWEVSVGQGFDSESMMVGDAHRNLVAEGVWEADGLYIIAQGLVDFDMWDMTCGEVLFTVENDEPSKFFPDSTY